MAVIDPALTDVWRRRVVAALIDLALVVGVLALLSVLQAESFTSDGAGFYSPQDLDRMEALDDLPNRILEIGDTVYVLAGGALLMTVVVTLGLIAGIHVALPAALGTSPGKWVTGLRVVTTDGDLPEYRHTGIRTAVGLVDLLPVVVPWAVGAAVASRSPHHQRLGDRVAGTLVVDGRRPLTTVAREPVPAARAAEPLTAEELAPVVQPDPLLEPAHGHPSPAVVGASSRRDRPARRPPPPAHRSGTGAAPAPRPGHEAPSAAIGPQLDEPATVEHPAQRPITAERERGASAGVEPDEPAADRTRQVPALARAGAGGPGTRRVAPPPQHRTGVSVDAPLAAPPTPAPPDQGWEPPRAEPAPVWDPTVPIHPLDPGADLGTTGDPDRRSPAPPADDPVPGPPDAAADERPGDAGLADPGLASAGPEAAEAPPGATPPPTTPGAGAVEVAGTGTGHGPSPTAPPEAPERSDADPQEPAADPVPAAEEIPVDEPVWNDEWQAWLYFDREQGRWHRHDTARGEWTPIS